MGGRFITNISSGIERVRIQPHTERWRVQRRYRGDKRRYAGRHIGDHTRKFEN
jgi:hypothetical protein